LLFVRESRAPASDEESAEAKQSSTEETRT
jgi:hypothetical protein